MSEHPPAWVVEHAQETSEAFNLPFHVALQRQLSWIEESFGMIPKEDPLREHKQKNADELQEITTMSEWVDLERICATCGYSGKHLYVDDELLYCGQCRVEFDK